MNMNVGSQEGWFVQSGENRIGGFETMVSLVSRASGVAVLLLTLGAIALAVI